MEVKYFMLSTVDFSHNPTFILEDVFFEAQFAKVFSNLWENVIG